MKSMRLSLAGSLLLTLLLASFGCGGSSDSSSASPPVRSAQKTFGTLAFQVSTSHQTNKRGEVIPILFTVTNTDTNTASFTFRECFDFVDQISQNGQPVNTGPTAEACSGDTRTVTLAPGATQTYTYRWNQTTAVSPAVQSPVSPGTYKVVARLLPDTIQGLAADPNSDNFVTNPISIVIAP